MQRSLSPKQWVADMALASALTVAGQLQLTVPNDDGYYAGPAVLNVVVTALTTLALALRRVLPVPVAMVIFGVHVVTSLVVAHSVSFWGTVIPMAVALYSAARWGRVERPAVLLALPAAFMATYGLHVPEFRFFDEVLFTAMLMAASWGSGQVINQLSRQRASLREALALVAEQEDERHRKVLLEERASIAREMHDIVAHGVSVMVVQAGAARMDLDNDPSSARDALLTVERTGREVLVELRRTVSLLRTTEADPAGQPAPGLDRLESLVDAMRSTGLEVDLCIEVEEPPDQGRGLTVYRLVQEALTNVLRHAHGSRVTVRIWQAPDLTVEVRNTGRPRTPAPPRSSGHGLVGMRERVAMHGGQFQASATGDGFVVRATLPAAQVPS